MGEAGLAALRGSLCRLLGRAAAGLPTAPTSTYVGGWVGMSVGGPGMALLNPAPAPPRPAPQVHTVSPGMILTDLLLEGSTTANKQVGRQAGQGTGCMDCMHAGGHTHTQAGPLDLWGEAP